MSIPPEVRVILLSPNFVSSDISSRNLSMFTDNDDEKPWKAPSADTDPLSWRKKQTTKNREELNSLITMTYRLFRDRSLFICRTCKMRLDSSSALLRRTQIKVKIYLRRECIKSYILQVGRGNYSISLKGGFILTLFMAYFVNSVLLLLERSIVFSPNSTSTTIC